MNVTDEQQNPFTAPSSPAETSDAGTPIEILERNNLALSVNNSKVSTEKSVDMIKGGGANLYWIAGLSMVNMLLAYSESTATLIGGMAITQVFQGMGTLYDESIGGAAGTVVGFVANCLVIALFAFLGRSARKGYVWPLVVGLTIYAIDSLMFVLTAYWIGVAIHVFFVFMLSVAIASNRQCIRITRDFVAGGDVEPKPTVAG